MLSGRGQASRERATCDGEGVLNEYTVNYTMFPEQGSIGETKSTMLNLHKNYTSIYLVTLQKRH